MSICQGGWNALGAQRRGRDGEGPSPLWWVPILYEQYRVRCAREAEATNQGFKVGDGVRMGMDVTLVTDGGARSSIAAAAYVVVDPDGVVLASRAEVLSSATNNEAEYHAFLAGIAACEDLGADTVHHYSDSKLLVMQLRGWWRVKAGNLRPLHRAARVAVEAFDEVKHNHVPRENPWVVVVDGLANEAMDAGASVVDEAGWRMPAGTAV